MSIMSLEIDARAVVLTNRERQVAALVCEGRPNKNIAHELSLSEGAVKIHLNRIFQKLRVQSRSELISRYFKIRT
jgi:two-component system, NarL family, nitrate/nitrite response regulator NarL